MNWLRLSDGVTCVKPPAAGLEHETYHLFQQPVGVFADSLIYIPTAAVTAAGFRPHGALV